ncbi:hypothetical protein DPMN_047241, partial [Dreissena polymorpha]
MLQTERQIDGRTDGQTDVIVGLGIPDMTIDLTPNFEETSEKCSLVFRSSAPNDSKVRGFVVVV